ncbi:hypothetical protein AMTRI_Chr02g256450 [Amborella trichopoda]
MELLKKVMDLARLSIKLALSFKSSVKSQGMLQGNRYEVLASNVDMCPKTPNPYWFFRNDYSIHYLEVVGCGNLHGTKDLQSTIPPKRGIQSSIFSMGKKSRVSFWCHVFVFTMSYSS